MQKRNDTPTSQATPDEREQREDSLFDRRLPETSIPREVLATYMHVLTDLFGSKWSVGPLWEHQLRTVMWRKDWIASTELLALGRALHHLQRSTKPATLARWIRDVQRLKKHQLSGSLWEAYTAGILAGDEQEVALTPANKPGVDLVVTSGCGHTWHVSCKHLGRSDAERSFHTHAVRTYRSIQASMPPGPPIKVAIHRRRPARRIDSDTVARKITAAACSLALCHEQRSIRAARHDVHVARFAAPLGSEFAEGYRPRSMMVTYAVPMSPTEQGRIERRVRQACTNLGKHAPAPSATSSNIVVIRVPEAVSLLTAQAWIKKFLDDNPNPAVTSVLIVRPSIQWTAHGPFDYRYFLAYETLAYRNPHRVGEEVAPPLLLTPVMGRGMSEENMVTITSALGSYSTEDHYLFADGQVLYSRLPEVEGHETWSVPVLPHYRVGRLEQIPGGPAIPLGAELGTDIAGLRERPRMLDLELM